jgi:hypothetical protein
MTIPISASAFRGKLFRGGEVVLEQTSGMMWDIMDQDTHQVRLRGQLKAEPRKLVGGERYRLQLRDDRELDIVVFRVNPATGTAEFEEAVNG